MKTSSSDAGIAASASSTDGDADTLFGCGSIALAADDDVRPSRQRLASDLIERLAPHDHVMPHRQRLEALQIGRQVPRQLVVAADDAVRGDGGEEGDAHGGMICGSRGRRGRRSTSVSTSRLDTRITPRSAP